MGFKLMTPRSRVTCCIDWTSQAPFQGLCQSIHSLALSSSPFFQVILLSVWTVYHVSWLPLSFTPVFFICLCQSQALELATTRIWCSWISEHGILLQFADTVLLHLSLFSPFLLWLSLQLLFDQIFPRSLSSLLWEACLCSQVYPYILAAFIPLLTQPELLIIPLQPLISTLKFLFPLSFFRS